MNNLGPRQLGTAWALAFLLAGCSPPAVDAQRQKEQSIQFLSENQNKPGIVTTASGLQYQILTEGKGASPKATDKVRVNYRGSLISGSEFDSGEDIGFPLNQVIPGWTEGLQLMKVGGKTRFFIPPQLAYGETGAGRVIPPNAALIFEVELLAVAPP